MPEALKLHPAIDDGVKSTDSNFKGGVLVCLCRSRPVKVRIKGQIAHNHACGCTKCWKPEGATLSVVAVAPHENIEVLENGDKLKVVDAAALIQRHACVRPHVRPGRARPCLQGPGLHSPRTFPGTGLVGARLCGLRLLRDRSGRRSRPHGRHPRAVEGTEARAV